MPYRFDEGPWVLFPADSCLERKIFRGEWTEFEERRVVSSMLEPGNVFVDAGANFGLYTLLASRLVGSAGQVHSFEPSPQEHEKLELNVRFNRIGNVTLNRMALGRAPGEAVLNVYGNGLGALNCLAKANVAAPVTEIRIPVTTLDDYVPKAGLSRLDFLKIDIEGAELPAFHGAARTLDGLRPIILCEVSEELSRAFGYTPAELMDFLRGHAYEIFRTDGEAFRADARLPEAYNFLAVPKEKLGFFRARMDASARP